MNDQQIYAMTSHHGYGIAIDGNFAQITVSPATEGYRYTVTVSSFPTDRATQYRAFQDLDEAVEWAIATAQTHKPQPNPLSLVVHWEHRKGYAITVSKNEVRIGNGESGIGGYESSTFPMWHDLDQPTLNDTQRFPTVQEALEYARSQVDAYQQSEEHHSQLVRQIGDKLHAHTHKPETTP